MRKCKVSLENIPGSPYSQSAKQGVPMQDRESHEDYDIRTWRDKCNVNEAGQVIIPAMALKQAIDTAAYKLGIKVPNRRGATYKNFFQSGVICTADAPLANGKALQKADAIIKSINANADGVRGSGKRVTRRFPEFHKWHTSAEFLIVDDIITEEIFETTLRAAGMIVGIGRFRVENGGTYGRFRITKIEWEDLKIA